MLLVLLYVCTCIYCTHAAVCSTGTSRQKRQFIQRVVGAAVGTRHREWWGQQWDRVVGAAVG